MKTKKELIEKRNILQKQIQEIEQVSYDIIRIRELKEEIRKCNAYMRVIKHKIKHQV